MRWYSNNLINREYGIPFRHVVENVLSLPSPRLTARTPEQGNNQVLVYISVSLHSHLCQVCAVLPTGTSSKLQMQILEGNNCNARHPYRSHTSCGWYSANDKLQLADSAVPSHLSFRESFVGSQSGHAVPRCVSEENSSWRVNVNQSIETSIIPLQPKPHKLNALAENVQPHYAKKTIAFERFILERKKQTSCDSSTVSTGNVKNARTYHKSRNCETATRERKSILTGCQSDRPSIRTAQQDITRLLSRCYIPRRYPTQQHSTFNKPKVSKTFRLSSEFINRQLRDSAIQVSVSPSTAYLNSAKPDDHLSISAVADKVVQTVETYPACPVSICRRSESLTITNSSTWCANRSIQNARTDASSDLSMSTSNQDQSIGVCSSEVLEACPRRLVQYPRTSDQPSKRALQSADPIFACRQSDLIDRSGAPLWDVGKYKAGSFLVDGTISSDCDTGATISSTWETWSSMIKVTHVSSGLLNSLQTNYFYTNSELRRGNEIGENQLVGRLHMHDDYSIDHLATYGQYDDRRNIHNGRIYIPDNMRSTFSSFNLLKEQLVGCGLHSDSWISALSPSLTTCGDTSDIALVDSTRSENCSLRVDGEVNRDVMEFFATFLNFSKGSSPNPKSTGVLALSSGLANEHIQLRKQLQGTSTMSNLRPLKRPSKPLHCPVEKLNIESATLAYLSVTDFNATGVLMPIGEVAEQIVVKLWASAYQPCKYLTSGYSGLQVMTLCLRLTSTISQCRSLELPSNVFCRLLTEYVWDLSANRIVFDVVAVKVIAKTSHAPAPIPPFSSMTQSCSSPELIASLCIAISPADFMNAVHSGGLDSLPYNDLGCEVHEHNELEAVNVIIDVRLYNDIFQQPKPIESNVSEICKQSLRPQNNTFNLCPLKHYSKKEYGYQTLRLWSAKMDSPSSNKEGRKSLIGVNYKVNGTRQIDGEVYFRRVVLGSKNLENHFQHVKSSFEKRIRTYKAISSETTAYIPQFMTYAHQSSILFYNEYYNVETEIHQVYSFEERIFTRQLNIIPQETQTLEVIKKNGPLDSERIFKVKQKLLFGALIMECLSQVELQEFWEPRVGKVRPCSNNTGLTISTGIDTLATGKLASKYGGKLLPDGNHYPLRLRPTGTGCSTEHKNDRLASVVDQYGVQDDKLKHCLCFRSLASKDRPRPIGHMRHTESVVKPMVSQGKAAIRETYKPEFSVNSFHLSTVKLQKVDRPTGSSLTCRQVVGNVCRSTHEPNGFVPEQQRSEGGKDIPKATFENWTSLDESGQRSECNDWSSSRVGETFSCSIDFSEEISVSMDNREIDIVDLPSLFSEQLSNDTNKKDSPADTESLISGQLEDTGQSGNIKCIRKFIWSPNSLSSPVINQHVLRGSRDKDGHHFCWETLPTENEKTTTVTQFIPLQILYSQALLQNIEKVSTTSSCSENEIFFNDESTCTTLHKSCMQTLVPNPNDVSMKVDSISRSLHTARKPFSAEIPNKGVPDTDTGCFGADDEQAVKGRLLTICGDTSKPGTIISPGYLQYLDTMMSFVMKAWRTPLRSDGTDGRLKSFSRRLRTIFLLTGPTNSLCGVLDILLRNGIFVLLTDTLHQSQQTLFHQITSHVKVKLLPKSNSYLSLSRNRTPLTVDEQPNELRDELAALYTIFLFANSMKSSQLLMLSGQQMADSRSSVDGHPEDCVQAVSTWWQSFWWASRSSQQSQRELGDVSTLYSRVMEALFPARKTIRHRQPVSAAELTTCKAVGVAKHSVRKPVDVTVTVANTSKPGSNQPELMSPDQQQPHLICQNTLADLERIDMGTQTAVAAIEQLDAGQDDLRPDANNSSSTTGNSANSYSLIRRPCVYSETLPQKHALLKESPWVTSNTVSKSAPNHSINRLLFAEEDRLWQLVSACFNSGLSLEQRMLNAIFQFPTNDITTDPVERLSYANTLNGIIQSIKLSQSFSTKDNLDCKTMCKVNEKGEKLHQDGILYVSARFNILLQPYTLCSNCSNVECHDFQLFSPGDTNISLVDKHKYFLAQLSSSSLYSTANDRRTPPQKYYRSLSGNRLGQTKNDTLSSYIGNMQETWYMRSKCQKYSQSNTLGHRALMFPSRDCLNPVTKYLRCPVRPPSDCNTFVLQFSTQCNHRFPESIISPQGMCSRMKVYALPPYSTRNGNCRHHSTDFGDSKSYGFPDLCMIYDTAMHNSKKVLKLTVNPDSDSPISSLQSLNVQSASSETRKVSTSVSKIEIVDPAKHNYSINGSIASSNDASRRSQKRSVYDSTYASRRRAPSKRILVDSMDESSELEALQKYSYRASSHDTFCKKEQSCCRLDRPTQSSEIGSMIQREPCRCKPIVRKSSHRTWESRGSKVVCACALLQEDPNELSLATRFMPSLYDNDQSSGTSGNREELHTKPKKEQVSAAVQNTPLVADVHTQTEGDMYFPRPLPEVQTEKVYTAAQNIPYKPPQTPCSDDNTKAKPLRCCQSRTTSVYNHPSGFSLTATVNVSHNQQSCTNKNKCQCFRYSGVTADDNFDSDNRMAIGASPFRRQSRDEQWKTPVSPDILEAHVVAIPARESPFHTINRQHHNAFQVCHTDSSESSSQHDREEIFDDKSRELGKSNERDCSLYNTIKAPFCYPAVSLTNNTKGIPSVFLNGQRDKGKRLCICSPQVSRTQDGADTSTIARLRQGCPTENTEEKADVLFCRRTSASKNRPGAPLVAGGCCQTTIQPGSPIRRSRALWFDESQHALVKSHSWSCEWPVTNSTAFRPTGVNSLQNEYRLRQTLIGGFVSSKVAEENSLRFSPECVSEYLSKTGASLTRDQGYSPVGFLTNSQRDSINQRSSPKIIKLRRSSASLTTNTVSRARRSILRDSSQSFSRSSITSESNTKVQNYHSQKGNPNAENIEADSPSDGIGRSDISRSSSMEIKTNTRKNSAELNSGAKKQTPLARANKKHEMSYKVKAMVKKQTTSSFSSPVQSEHTSSGSDHTSSRSPRSRVRHVQERQKWCVSNTIAQTDQPDKPTSNGAMVKKEKVSKGKTLIKFDEVVHQADIRLPASRNAYVLVKTSSTERTCVDANRQSPAVSSTMNKVTMSCTSQNAVSVCEAEADEGHFKTTADATLPYSAALNNVNGLHLKTEECDEPRVASQGVYKRVSSTSISSTSEVSIDGGSLKVNQTFTQTLETSTTAPQPPTYARSPPQEPVSPTACTSTFNTVKPTVHGKTAIHEQQVKKRGLKVDQLSIYSRDELVLESPTQPDLRAAISDDERDAQNLSMNTSLFETQSGRRTPTPGGVCLNSKTQITPNRGSDRMVDHVQPNSNTTMTENIRFDQIKDSSFPNKSFPIETQQKQPECNVGSQQVDPDRSGLPRNSTSTRERVTETIRRGSLSPVLSCTAANSLDFSTCGGVKETRNTGEQHTSRLCKTTACDCCKCGRLDRSQGCNFTMTSESLQPTTQATWMCADANEPCVGELLIRFRADTCPCERRKSSGNRMVQPPNPNEARFPFNDPDGGAGYEGINSSPFKQNTIPRPQAPPLQPAIVPARSFQSLESEDEVLSFSCIGEESSVELKVSRNEPSPTVSVALERSYAAREERPIIPVLPKGRPSLWPSSSSKLCASYSSVPESTASSDSVSSSVDDSKIRAGTKKETPTRVPSAEVDSKPDMSMEECKSELNALKEVLSAKKQDCAGAFCQCSSGRWQPFIPYDHCEMHRQRRHNANEVTRKPRRKLKKYSTSVSRIRAELAKQLTNCPVSTADSKKLEEELASELSASTLACLRKYLFENGLTQCRNTYSHLANMDSPFSSKMTPVRMASLNCWIFPGGGVRHVVPCTCHERAMADIARGLFPDYPPERPIRSRVFTTSKHSGHSSLGHRGSSAVNGQEKTQVAQKGQNGISHLRMKQDSPLCCKNCPAMTRLRDMTENKVDNQTTEVTSKQKQTISNRHGR